MSLAVELGAFVCGAGAGALARTLLIALRPVSVRCAWCGRIRVSASGQACKVCIDTVLNGHRAAPADWPEA